MKGRRRVALVIGESENDTRALRELISGLNPALGRIAQIRKAPTFLVKNVAPRDLPSRAQQVRGLVAAERIRHDIVCLVAHEDADDLPPADVALENDKRGALAGLGVPVHAVVPAWEIEAWWFLWPDAAPLVCAGWRAPTEYEGRAVDRIQNAKERYRDATLKRGLNAQQRAHARKYQESDAPTLARLVAERGWAKNAKGTAGAWARFRAAIETQAP